MKTILKNFSSRQIKQESDIFANIMSDRLQLQQTPAPLTQYAGPTPVFDTSIQTQILSAAAAIPTNGYKHKTMLDKILAEKRKQAEFKAKHPGYHKEYQQKRKTKEAAETAKAARIATLAAEAEASAAEDRADPMGVMLRTVQRIHNSLNTNVCIDPSNENMQILYDAIAKLKKLTPP